MATMADMFSLLLTFFVLLLSFANMDVVKFRMMLGSVQDAFGVQTEHPGDIPARATSPVEFSNRESTPYLQIIDLPSRKENESPDKAMVTEIEDAISRLDLGRLVEVLGTERGVVVQVKDQLLFDAGSSTLRANALVFLDEIARLTQIFPHDLAVDGHTDASAVGSGSFASNWELGAARSISALRYLVEAGGLDPTTLSAASYGDTRPLVPNDTAEGRAKNRRVEFVFLRGALSETRGHARQR
jgi:chemotaxis protein MotB